MRASASSLWYKMCTWDFLTNMAAHILTNKKKLTLCKHRFRVTHNRNGEPDIPRDKVSPKNKMPNILFIGNL